jgi:E3 ubiquitin-protein ligase RNF144
MSWCPTPDCKYIFFLDGGNTNEFLCPICLKYYCLDCRTDYHIGLTCEEYINDLKQKNEIKEDEKFIIFAKGMKLK